MNADLPLEIDRAAAPPQAATTLDTLPEGQWAQIAAVDTSDPLAVRLMTLGLVEGAEIQRTSGALGGDPLEFSLFGVRISLRREQARRFRVTSLSRA